LQPDGSLDDQAISNNGDIVKVLATVINIIRDFTMQHPDVYVTFAGSTDERMKLYTRILKSYFSAFREEFIVKALVKVGGGFKEVSFDPKLMTDYTFFLIKRII
jgi:uncharacterized protein DUF6934